MKVGRIRGGAGAAARVWRAVLVLVCAGWCGAARGQGTEEQGHAWVVLTQGPARAAVLHLPPRQVGEDRPTVRVARWFTGAPERLGWHGTGVWFVFPPEPRGTAGPQCRSTQPRAA